MNVPWKRSEDVVWDEFNGEAVLVSTKTRKTWVLNAVGSFVWRCCDGLSSLDDIAARLGATDARIRAEIAGFLAQLQQRGLVQAVVCVPGGKLATINVCFSGTLMPPMIKLEGPSLGVRHRPSSRAISGGGQ